MFRVAPRLTVAALALPTRAAYDDEEKAVKEAGMAVKKLSGQLDAKDIAKQAEAVAKKHDIEYVMHAFKPRSKGGEGVGATAPPMGVKDSIELAVIDFGTKKGALNAAAIKQSQADLLQLARTTQAIAEITYFYPPPKKPGAKPANWKAHLDEMKAGAKDLTEAIKAGDADKFKTASLRVNASCNNCHSEFRDNPGE